MHRLDLYVCELHGYNVEGQYDIEELYKTVQFDPVVRRIQADEQHRKAAKTEIQEILLSIGNDDF